MSQSDIPQHIDLGALLQVAINAAQEPADVILHYFNQSSLVVDKKTDKSPVTEADREAERCIRQRLPMNVSGESIDVLGEEQGFSGKGSRFRWTIDPIDGTRSFVRGIPLFGTIVALEDTVDQRTLIGVIHLPVLKLTYSAGRGLGSWCNGSRNRVSSVGVLDEAFVSVGDPLQFAHAQCLEMYARLVDKSPCLRGYSDCFGHGLVASGALDVMVDPDLNPWDVLATQVLVEEAGGTMIMRPSVNHGKVDALFGNADLVSHLAEELQFLAR